MSTQLNVIELRDGSARDIAIIDALMQAAFEPRFGEAWTRNQCLGILAMPGIWLTIASIDGAPAGFALCRAVADEAELLLLATAPVFRRRGVASALLRAVEADATRLGVATLHIEVREGNEAIKLYRNWGFRKIGQRREYYRGSDGQVFDALTFQRKLRPAQE
jgi:[ribosomal protein S18]-alanine N-acetyltransferase